MYSQFVARGAAVHAEFAQEVKLGMHDFDSESALCKFL